MQCIEYIQCIRYIEKSQIFVSAAFSPTIYSYLCGIYLFPSFDSDSGFHSITIPFFTFDSGSISIPVSIPPRFRLRNVRFRFRFRPAYILNSGIQYLCPPSGGREGGSHLKIPHGSGTIHYGIRTSKYDLMVASSASRGSFFVNGLGFLM